MLLLSWVCLSEATDAAAVGAAAAAGGSGRENHQSGGQNHQRALQQAAVDGITTTVGYIERAAEQQLQLAANNKSTPIVLLPLQFHKPPELDMRLVPADFDWQKYLLYNPDILASGVITEEMSRIHYASFGHKEGRLFKPLSITLRYTACGGLINQHYCHMAAIALAHHLEVPLIFPPALARDSFQNYFSSHPKHNEIHWQAHPPSTIWDMDHIIDYWKGRGLTITPAPAPHTLPDLVKPRSAHPAWLPPGYDWTHVARLPTIYLTHQTLPQLAAAANAAAIALAKTLPNPYAPILVDLPCVLFMLDTRSAPVLVEEIARSLKFAPAMVSIANRVVSALKEPRFNGLHLRLERDARDWARNLGGRDVLLGMYLDAAKRAGFAATEPLYLATGLFSYKKGAAEENALVRRLHGVCNRVHTKEHHMAADDAAALVTPEHKALVDFLVLAHCQHFVGMGLSSFSVFLPQYRQMFLGKAPESSVLVDGGAAGRKSDVIFAAATRVVGF